VAGASFTDVTNKTLSRGIDSYSSKAAIPEGYVEDMENFDTNASGLIQKRKGYVSHSGWLPIRVTRVVHSGTKIRFYLDTSQSIDLSSVDLYTILAYGRLDSSISASGSMTSTNACSWMSDIAVINREDISSGSNTITKTADDHGYSTNQLFVGFAESDSPTNNSNTQLIPDAVKVDTSTYEVEVDYTANTTAEGFVYISNKSAVAGSMYVDTLTADTTKNISSLTHALTNNYIQVRAYDTSGPDYVEVIPDSVEIDVSGNVYTTFSTAVTGVIILSVADLDKVESTSAALGSNSLTIASPGSPFNFVDVYAYNTSSSRFEAVIPDSVTYDETADEITIGYTVAAAA